MISWKRSLQTLHNFFNIVFYKLKHRGYTVQSYRTRGGNLFCTCMTNHKIEWTVLHVVICAKIEDFIERSAANSRLLFQYYVL